VDAILLGCLAGIAFGAMTVAVRFGLRHGARPEAGALAASLVGAAIAAAAALVSGVSPAGFAEGRVWVFLLIGAFVPGISQAFFVAAVRDAGPSRAAILIGTAPLLSALIAVAFRDEPYNAGLALGTVLIVVGGALLAWEPERPVGFKAAGAVLALLCAAMFAGRDNAVRAATEGAGVPGLVAAAASMAGACVALSTYLLVTRGRGAPREAGRALLPFLPAGVALGVAYGALVLAFDRGKVTLVAPFNATQSLWTVVFSAALIGASERIGRRVVVAASLVVAGGAVVGVFR
jgi:drug/metabolite transporter (DMT)-like permease